MHSSSSLQSNTVSVLGEMQRLVLEQQNQAARICGYSSMVSHYKEEKSISTNDDTAVDASGDGAAVCPPPLPCFYTSRMTCLETKSSVSVCRTDQTCLSNVSNFRKIPEKESKKQPENGI